MTTPDLLDLIETLCVLFDNEYVDLRVANGEPVAEREKRMARALEQIYKFTHAHTKHSCSHPDWKREAEAAYAAVKQL